MPIRLILDLIALPFELAKEAKEKKVKAIREQVAEIVRILGKDGAYRDKQAGISMDYQGSTSDRNWVRDCVIMLGSETVFSAMDQVCSRSCGPEVEDVYIEHVLHIRTFERGAWENRIDELEKEANAERWRKECEVKNNWEEQRRKRLQGE